MQNLIIHRIRKKLGQGKEIPLTALLERLERRALRKNKKMTKESKDVDCLICYSKTSSNSITKHLQNQHKNTANWKMIFEKQCDDLCWLKHTECDGENLSEKPWTEELRQLSERKDLIMEMKTLFCTIENTLEKQTEKCKKKLLKLKKGSKVTPKKSSPSVKRKAADTSPRRTSRKQIQTGNGFYIRC